MTPDLNVIAKDVKTIQAYIEQATGLTSRWNGTIVLIEDVRADGSPVCRARKNWDCSIALHVLFLNSPDLLMTLVHEVLHSVSAGLAPTSFRDFRGYEEGVVERLTQVFYPQVAGVLGVVATMEDRHAFDVFLQPLEQLRTIVQMETMEFYISLLRTPLADREAAVVQWAKHQYVEDSNARVLARIALVLRKLRG